MKYLVVVNPQNDYLDGALSNKEACAIIGGICDKIVEYENNNWPIFVVYDKRDEDYLTTYESKKFLSSIASREQKVTNSISSSS